MVAFYRDVLDVETDWDGEGPYAEFVHEGIRFAMYERSKLPALLGQEPSYPDGLKGDAHDANVMAEMGLVRNRRCQDALDLLESKRLADGTFPVEWTNVKHADQIESRGTYADWGPLHKRKGNPLVTVDALYVLREAGRG